jgi:uncharacterized membrane protein YhaH (DUF805 family)
MSDLVRRASEGAGAGKLGWLDGRASRREYWLWVGPITIIDLTLEVAFPGMALFVALPGGIAIFLIMVRRFHDIGWSGFAVPAVNVVLNVSTFALLGLLGKEIGAVVALLVSFVAKIVIGAWPGQPFANRYGAPRRGKDVGEVFS